MENMSYQITFDGFGFNDANDPHKRRLATLPAVWKDEGARQQFGHEVVRAVNSHADLLAALEHCSVQLAMLDPLAEHHNAELLDNALAKAKGV